MLGNSKFLQAEIGKLFGMLVHGTTRQRALGWAMIVGFVGLLVAPFLVGGYWIRVLTGVLMFVILSEAWNVISGYTNYFAFGNVVFLGVGAYTTAVLVVDYAIPLFLAILIGGILAAVYAMLLGFPLLRLTGHYFSIATIGINLATREIVTNLSGITGGGRGITMPLMRVSIEVFYRYIYFMMFGLMMVCIAAVYLLIRSRMGFALRAIGGDEQAAKSMGINTTKYKVLAWGFSAFFFGLTGGIYAYWFSFIEPPMVFNPADAIKIVAMTYLGGIRTILGPLIGAFILELVSEMVWGRFLELHLAVLGSIIVFVTIFMPDGLMPIIRGEVSLRGLFKNIKDRKL